MRAPNFWYKEKSILSLLLLPLSIIWLLLSYFKNTLRKRYSFSKPIICVGNVVAGGSGKTPLVIEMCKYYRKRNINVHVVYKAYKVNLAAKVIKIDNNTEITQAEDEALLISNYAPTWLCKKRKDGINFAISKGAKLIILDDGLQDISIKKTINILVSNELQGNGNFKIIPAGPLRETISNSQRKSHCIFFYGNQKSFSKQFFNYKKPVFFGNQSVTKKSINKIKNKKVIGFAGIAYPDNFFSLIEKYGLNLVEKIYYPDHYIYSSYDIKMILQKANNNKALALTTYKDHVKIPKNLKKDFSILDIYIKFDKKKFFNFLDEKLKFNV